MMSAETVRAAALGIALCIVAWLASGCRNSDANPHGPKRPGAVGHAPTTWAESCGLETMVTMVEPEITVHRPKTEATVTTSESGVEVTATLTESEGRTHIASMRADEGLSADTLGLELPPDARRLVGADLTRLESASTLYQSLAGSRGVVYEVPRPAEMVLDFYRGHPSGRFEVFDREAMAGLGLESAGGDVAVIFDLEEPTRAIAIQTVGERLTRLMIVDLSGSALGAGETEEGPS